MANDSTTTTPNPSQNAPGAEKTPAGKTPDAAQQNTPAPPPAAQAGKGDGTPPPEGETKQERKWRLQREGKIEELDDRAILESLVSELGEEGVINAAQLSREARSRLTRAEKARKEFESALQDINDPARAMRLLEKKWGGRDNLRKAIEDWYAGDLEERMMPPEKREHKALTNELEQLRAEKKRIEDERRRQAEQQEVQRWHQELNRTFVAELKAAGVDPTPHAISRMAWMAEGYVADRLPIDAKAIAREIAQEYEAGEVAAYIRKLAQNPEKLAKHLGPEGMRKLRQYEAEAGRAPQAGKGGNPAAPAQQNPAPPTRRLSAQGENTPRMTVDEYYESLRRKGR